jgi:hypothetical protein
MGSYDPIETASEHDLELFCRTGGVRVTVVDVTSTCGYAVIAEKLKTTCIGMKISLVTVQTSGLACAGPSTAAAVPAAVSPHWTEAVALQPVLIDAEGLLEWP